MKRIVNIADISPFLGFEKGCLLSKRGDISILFELLLPEIYTLSDSEYETVNELWSKAIGTLPDSTMIHKQDYYITGNYNAKDHSAYELHFNHREYLSHRSFLYITLCPQQKKTIISQDSTENFLSAAENFKSILESTGVLSLRKLDTEDIFGNESSLGLIDRYINISSSELNDLILNDNKLISGKKTVFFYTIPDADILPPEVEPCKKCENFSTEKSHMFLSLAHTLGLGSHFNHIYNQYIFLDNTTSRSRQFESIRRRMISLSKYSRQNQINAECIEQYLDQVVRNGERIVRAHYSVMTWAENESQEKMIRNTFSAAFGQIGITPHLDIIDAPDLFLAGIPGNGGRIPLEESFYTFVSHAVCLFTGETSYKSSPSDFGIKLCDRDSGLPVHVDISDLPWEKGYIDNRNKFVLGPSGSGKSFFMNHLLQSYYNQGASIIVIDIGHSYKGLCSLINEKTNGRDGIYYTFDGGNTLSFNPFHYSCQAVDDIRIENVRSLLTRLWKNDDEPLSREEENFVGDMVSRYFRSGHEKPCFNDFYEYVEMTAIKNRMTANFLSVLATYYKGGRYEHLLNSDRETELMSCDFVVFELDAVKDNPILMTVTSVVIMELFSNKLNAFKGRRKVLVIEEAWKALATNHMAAYIKNQYKTLRKHFGEIIVVTQELDDILSSEIVRESIIANSDCKILMDLSGYVNKFSDIENKLGLSEKQKAEILSINRSKNYLRPPYKELWIGFKNLKSKVYSLEVSKEEYFTYTTEEREKRRVMELAEKLGSYTDAVKEISKIESKENSSC